MNRFVPLAALFVLLSIHEAGAADPARITSRPDGAEMILIPAGPFTCGIEQAEIRKVTRQLKVSWDRNIYPREFPRHEETLPAFYIDRYEVSNEQYQRFVAATRNRPARFARYPQLRAPKQPVVGVGWGDAEAYCRWSGKRLPTEYEWEKAARGTDGRNWPWGNTADAKAYNGKSSGYFAPVKVGSFSQGDSPFGVADMAGNVWEMTSSVWDDGSKVMRGGSFLNHLGDVRTTVRWAADNEETGANWLGFRCAKDPGPAKR